MKPIILEKTETTPLVIFNNEINQFRLEGEARPENARKFFGPLINWLDEYNKTLFYLKEEAGDSYLKKIVFEMYFEYLNSSSVKFMFDVLKKIEELKPNLTSLKIKWMYDEKDEDMLDNGNEFATMIDIPFEFEPVGK
jgi:hypothetical protein